MGLIQTKLISEYGLTPDSIFKKRLNDSLTKCNSLGKQVIDIRFSSSVDDGCMHLSALIVYRDMDPEEEEDAIEPERS